MATTAFLKLTKPASEHDAQKVATYNAAVDDLDGTTAGFLLLSVAGSSNVTLTRTQGLNKLFKFTGALTGNISVLFPAALGSAREFVVWNATTGAYTLTVKTTAGGSAGVAVTQGTKALLAHDDTDVFAATSGGSGVGGSTGSTDNRVLRADGTGGATVQNSLASIDDSGRFIAGDDGTAANCAYSGTISGSHVNSGMIFGGGGYYPEFVVNGSIFLAVGNGNYAQGPQLRNDGGIGWSNTSDPLAGLDTTISRAAAGTVQFGTTANDATGHVKAASIRGTAVAYASLPASPVEGMLVGVTDSNTATWGATIAGGGSNHVLAYYNGTNWTVAAK